MHGIWSRTYILLIMYFFTKSVGYRHLLTLNISAVDRFDHQFLFLRFSQKFFPATYVETLCKFLLYTYEDSNDLFWSKILSREHVEYVYIAWVKNVNFKDCNFRVLRGIFWGVSKSCLKLKSTRLDGLFFLIWAFLESKNAKNEFCTISG